MRTFDHQVELTGRRSNEFEEDLSRILKVIELVTIYNWH